jgi:hypothetical protein
MTGKEKIMFVKNIWIIGVSKCKNPKNNLIHSGDVSSSSFSFSVFSVFSILLFYF